MKHREKPKASSTLISNLNCTRCVQQAHHSDLIFFAECTANYNFDQWLQTMESKLEIGVSKHLQYQLRRVGDGVVMARSKPRMSAHVPYSPWYQIWPVERCHWPRRQGPAPSTPPLDSHPTPCRPQQWKSYDQVKKSLTEFYIGS